VILCNPRYFSNARREIQRNIKFTAKKLEEFKMLSMARVQLCPFVDATTLPSKVKHAFETGKQALIK
jgi:hypothetical protein